MNRFEGTQWEGVAHAAQAMRRLNRALAGRRADAAVLAEMTEQIDAMAQQLEVGTPRVKLDDMLDRPHLRPIYQGRHAPMPLAAGDEIEFDPFSIGGGRLHPASVNVSYFKESEDSVRAEAVVDPMFAGPPGLVHGGISALLIDELMGALTRIRGLRAYTARLTVDYRRPSPVGVPIRYRAWVSEASGRKIVQQATGEGPDGLVVEAEGLFVVPREPKAPGVGPVADRPLDVERPCT